MPAGTEPATRSDREAKRKWAAIAWNVKDAVLSSVCIINDASVVLTGKMCTQLSASAYSATSKSLTKSRFW